MLHAATCCFTLHVASSYYMLRLCVLCECVSVCVCVVCVCMLVCALVGVCLCCLSVSHNSLSLLTHPLTNYLRTTIVNFNYNQRSPVWRLRRVSDIYLNFSERLWFPVHRSFTGWVHRWAVWWSGCPSAIKGWHGHRQSTICFQWCPRRTVNWSVFL